MPDYGLVTADQLGITTPQLAPLYPALPWAVPGARLLKLAYELDLEGVRSTLPVGLARPTPPYGTLVVIDAADSPLGPFRMAVQTIACRYRNWGRVYVLQGVVDNPVALVGFRELFHYPLAPGNVELTTDPASGEVRGLVTTPAGAELAVFELTGVEGAEAPRVVIDSELTLRIPPAYTAEPTDEPARFIQVNREVTLRDPKRGRNTVKFSSSAGDAYPWGAIAVTNAIIGVDTLADLEYAAAEFMMDYIPTS